MTDNNTATETVNDLAKKLYVMAHAEGFEMTPREAQAIAVCGLMAAHQVVRGESWDDEDQEIREQGKALVSRILSEES